jgi:hypothetical protein
MQSLTVWAFSFLAFNHRAPQVVCWVTLVTHLWLHRLQPSFSIFPLSTFDIALAIS